MERIFRKKGDVGVAFSSIADSPHMNEPSSTSRVSPGVGARPVAPQATPSMEQVVGVPSQGLRSRIRVVLRVPARFLFRCLRPFVRPVLFRFRAYLLRDLRVELLQEIQQLHASSTQERKNLAAHAVRMTEAMRASLQEEIRGVPRQMEGALKRVAGDVASLGSGMEALAQSTAAAWSNLEVRLSDAGKQFHDSLHDVLAGQASALSLLSSRLDRIELYTMASTRRFAVSCGGEGVLVRTEVGYVLCPATDAALIAVLVESGDLERGTRLLIQRILKPGDVFVDVGANVGMHTLAAARAMDGRGRIIAFEPFPTTAHLLRRSVWLNGFSHMAEIHQAAVSTSDGPLPLYLGQTSGHHSLLPLSAEGDAAGKTDVPVERVDDVVGGSPVTLMKIDVEGAELQVLETARGTIEANPEIAIIIEFGRSHLLRAGFLPEQWLQAFTGLGLDFRVIDEATGSLEHWTIEQLQGVDSVNLLFARPGVPVLGS